MAECENIDGETIWKKNILLKSNSHEDVWDDTALIKAYDRAVAIVKGEIESELSENETRFESNQIKNQTRKKKSQKINWKIGDKCLALFTQDELYYEATILNIDSKHNVALVQYDYYGNKENIDMDMLLNVDEKYHLEYANDESDGMEESSTLSSTDRKQKIDHGHKSWQVSDICYFVDKEDTSPKLAVINSFPTKNKCNITLIKSGIQLKVDIKNLRAKSPQNSAKTSKKYFKSSSSSSHIPSHFLNQPNMNQPPVQPPWLPFFESQVPQPPQPPSFNGVMGSFVSPSIQIPPGFPQMHKVPPFPPPPSFLASGEEDEEALANMLMSWYMNGFHTGYYQGLQHAKDRYKNEVDSDSSDVNE